MTASIIIWLCVAAFLLGGFFMRVAQDNKTAHHRSHKANPHKFKFLELGKEREEFFIAGDPTSRTLQEDYDNFDY